MGNKHSRTSFKKCPNSETSTTVSSKKLFKVQPKQDELEKLYNKYKEEEEETYIGGDGIMKFLQDIHIDVMDIVVLVMMWKLKTKQQYKIEKQEFIEGFRSFGVETLDQIQGILPKWREEIKDKKSFKQFYYFVFQYSKPSNSKFVQPEIAIPTWKLLFSDYSLIETWCQFIENSHKKPISKDVWEQFLEFVNTIKLDLSNYDFNEESAWPIAIDDFVNFIKTK